ncbi:hypothetical protein PCURB6_37640 [Paenibacillus curdlanolyticus]|nr:hypothetical protein PCURB6_37640 [Paenibacillus curdlanolyticus]
MSPEYLPETPPMVAYELLDIIFKQFLYRGYGFFQVKCMLRIRDVVLPILND